MRKYSKNDPKNSAMKCHRYFEIKVLAITLLRIFFAIATAIREKNMNSSKIMNDGNSGITV